MPSTPAKKTVLDLDLREIIPGRGDGIVFSEKGPQQEVLCKPRLLPIKSIALERAEKMAEEQKDA
jgi:hypothetical protein